MRELFPLVTEAYEALGPPGVAEAALRRVAAWVELVRDVGRKIDLTAARDDRELVDLMVTDAALFAREIGPGRRVVDVGTGAGAPGLALALLRSDLAVTLVEPLEKRVTFLRTAIGKAWGGSDRAAGAPPRVVRARGEALVGQSFDVAVSRATLPPKAWLELGLALAPEAYVLLAQGEPPARAGAWIELDAAYVWPLTGARRRLLRYRTGP